MEKGEKYKRWDEREKSIGEQRMERWTYVLVGAKDGEKASYAVYEELSVRCFDAASK